MATKKAYWEAGFAEGLGLPVIYTCSATTWAKSKTHFDTNHMVTVVWDAADLSKAAKELTATIRERFAQKRNKVRTDQLEAALERDRRRL